MTLLMCHVLWRTLSLSLMCQPQQLNFLADINNYLNLTSISVISQSKCLFSSTFGYWERTLLCELNGDSKLSHEHWPWTEGPAFSEPSERSDSDGKTQVKFIPVPGEGWLCGACCVSTSGHHSGYTHNPEGVAVENK